MASIASAQHEARDIEGLVQDIILEHSRTKHHK